MSALAFTKMHGIGNDFVVIDLRDASLALDQAQARAIADRRTGVGCDQVIAVEPPRNARAEAYLRILNADGSEAEACGNGTRCVAALLMAEKGADHVTIETAAGLLDAARAADGEVTVDMGAARLDWRDIPLAEPADTAHLDISLGPLSDAVAVNMGNPHAVFFVDDAETVALADYGPALERHEMFPEGANIGVASVPSREKIRLRVWERGAGLTQACGSGACAAVVAASRRGLTGRKAEVALDGGVLRAEWLENGHVVMTGPVAVSFTGTLGEFLLP